MKGKVKTYGKVNEKKIKKSFAKIEKQIDLLYLPPDAAVVNDQTYLYLVKRCEELKIPLYTYSEQFVKHGALASFSPNYHNIGSQMAVLARKILLKGKSPKDINVKSPFGAMFVLNTGTAKKLGLNIQYLEDIVDKTYD